ncbi:MAG: TIM-barrel domain-containing protein [Bifidobacterium breve]
MPRWALGNWWSRYHRYSETEYRTLIERFETEGIPFTVAVLDMDWHVTDPDPCYGSGGPDSPRNRTLLHDPERFLGWLHERGLKTTLNLHPRDGIRAFEDCYDRMARAVGVDSKSGSSLSSMRPRRCSCPLTSIKSSTRWNLRALISGGSTGNKAA